MPPPPAAGHALAEELARRLGRNKCWRVQWPSTEQDTVFLRRLVQQQQQQQAIPASESQGQSGGHHFRWGLTLQQLPTNHALSGRFFCGILGTIHSADSVCPTLGGAHPFRGLLLLFLWRNSISVVPFQSWLLIVSQPCPKPKHRTASQHAMASRRHLKSVFLQPPMKWRRTPMWRASFGSTAANPALVVAGRTPTTCSCRMAKTCCVHASSRPSRCR